jgi:hypothetical protein
MNGKRNGDGRCDLFFLAASPPLDLACARATHEARCAIELLPVAASADHFADNRPRGGLRQKEAARITSPHLPRPVASFGETINCLLSFFLSLSCILSRIANFELILIPRPTFGYIAGKRNVARLLKPSYLNPARLQCFGSSRQFLRLWFEYLNRILDTLPHLFCHGLRVRFLSAVRTH